MKTLAKIKAQIHKLDDVFIEEVERLEKLLNAYESFDNIIQTESGIILITKVKHIRKKIDELKELEK